MTSIPPAVMRAGPSRPGFCLQVMDVIPLDGIEYIGVDHSHTDTAVPEVFATGTFSARVPLRQHRGKGGRVRKTIQPVKSGLEQKTFLQNAMVMMGGIMGPRKPRSRRGSVLGELPPYDASLCLSSATNSMLANIKGLVDPPTRRNENSTMAIRTNSVSYNLGKTYKVCFGSFLTAAAEQVHSLA